MTAIELLAMARTAGIRLEAIELAIDLEQRGFEMWLDQWEQVVIAPAQELSDRDRAAIARWRLHLGAIVGYEAPAIT